MRLTSIVLSVGLAAGVVLGQGAPPADSSTKKTEVPLPLQLGARTGAIRAATGLVSTVVIVSDAESYLAAVGAWTTKARFPVLIDDGSAGSREAIARFVRGYKPAGVVRWQAPGVKPVVGAEGFASISKPSYWKTVQRVWGVEKPSEDESALLAAWKGKGHRPPGVVVACEKDRSWVAAVALAAGWGQPTVFVEKQPGNIDYQLSVGEADQLAKTIEDGCGATGFAWNKLGDDLDAVTLALNCPERIAKASNEYLALTDRIGRLGEGIDLQVRWAWAGHIFGSASESAYMAMCSLFLEPEAAWVFDGYGDTAPWNNYDGTKAADIIKQTGMRVEVMDKPRGSAHQWRVRAGRPVEAGLIFVNTKGNSDYFDLEPGQCKPGDVPILSIPAAMHLVHSWSMLFPGKRDHLGGRWFERGVFAAAGSVHEPYLAAFVPTPAAAGRFVSGAPFGAAMRIDGGQMWKIAILADPLYTFGPAVRRLETPTGLADEQPVIDGLRELLTGEQYATAVVNLTLVGRDGDVAKLAAGLLDSKPDKVDASLARACVLPAFRAGDGDLIVRLFGKLGPEVAKEGILRDALWLSAYPKLEKPESDALLTVLKENVRSDQVERDAKTLAAAWVAKYGAGSTSKLFASLRERFTDKAAREALERVEKAPGQWGS